nr:hypothetical protein Iba_chr09bCG13220 [Ipomoea batatas]
MPLEAARNFIRDMDRLPTGKDLGKVPFNGLFPIWIYPLKKFLPRSKFSSLEAFEIEGGMFPLKLLIARKRPWIFGSLKFIVVHKQTLQPPQPPKFFRDMSIKAIAANVDGNQERHVSYVSSNGSSKTHTRKKQGCHSIMPAAAVNADPAAVRARFRPIICQDAAGIQQQPGLEGYKCSLVCQTNPV